MADGNQRWWPLFLRALFVKGLIVIGNPALAQSPQESDLKPPTDDLKLNQVTILEENDSLFFNSDKHYTQGLRLSYVRSGADNDEGWPYSFAKSAIAGISPDLVSGDLDEYAVFFGQSIFTPKNKAIIPPDPHDRPYAGWAYVGLSLLEERKGWANTLDNFELDLGVIGPPALGKQVQNDFHQFIGDPEAKGWSDQLQTEPGAVVSYERLWRVPLVDHAPSDPNHFGIDVVPQLGATVGNIFTYADAGALLRIGTGLGADYGPVRIRPALSGTDFFDPRALDDGVSSYFFAGAQGRAVARNIFLDGNTDRTSPSVAKRTLVGDAQGGFSFLWSKSVRADISVVLRSKEFYGQRGLDDICTAALTITW